MSNFTTARLESKYYIEDLLPDPETLLTFPLLSQLSSILHDNICWEDFKQLNFYKLDSNLAEAATVANDITSVHGVAVLLVSGKIGKTGEDAIFGGLYS